jgi:hypothetical protein
MRAVIGPMHPIFVRVFSFRARSFRNSLHPGDSLRFDLLHKGSSSLAFSDCDYGARWDRSQPRAQRNGRLRGSKTVPSGHRGARVKALANFEEVTQLAPGTGVSRSPVKFCLRSGIIRSSIITDIFLPLGLKSPAASI